MEPARRRFGRTGLEVTEIGLGGYQFTGEFGVHYDEADKILDLALNSGINYIDTAQMYGFGESEAIVGRAFNRHSGKKVYISDKLGYVDRGVSRAKELAAYQDPAELKRMIKHSFWLLRRDYVEIFMIHEPAINDWWKFDYETGDSVATSVLEELKKEGFIGAIGLGCWDSRILAKLCRTGRFDIALNAGGINLFSRRMFDAGLMDAAKEHDVGIVVGGVLAQGNAGELIAEKRDVVEKLKASDRADQQLHGRKLERLYEICRQSGVGILELSLRYVLSVGGIHCHIPGARLAEHLRQNIELSVKGPLPGDVVEEIVKVSLMK